MTTLASLDPNALNVVPGEQAACGLTVRNNGDIVESYQLQVVGEVAPWTTLDPPTLSLYPGSEARVNVTFAPPRSSRAGVGAVPYAVHVLPTERPMFAVAPEGMVTVLPFTETTAEIIPRTSKGRRRGKHEVAVDNRGNVPIMAEIVGGDPDNQLTVTPSPARLQVPPGQALFTTVAVRNRKRHWTGPPVTRPFQVVVTPENEQSIALDAATLQLAILPRNTGKIVAALAALALLVAGAWFFLVKPAVSSAAKEAVAKPLAQVSQKADTANKKADNAQNSANQANDNATKKSSSPSPSPKPKTSGSPAATTAPLALQMPTTVNAGTSGTATQTVPTKRQFAITDIVLENPQGDVGRMDIIINGNTVLTLSLANFRDLDYHFVSPINTTATNSVQVKVTCQTPGPTLAGSSGGSKCREFVFLSGANRPG
jgi:hypothetical protein